MIEELKEAAQKVAPHGATNASVAHLNDLLFGRNEKVVVDTYLTVFIDDDGHSAAMVGGQDAVEESSFTCAEESC
jgi:hypothetical protein